MYIYFFSSIHISMTFPWPFDFSSLTSPWCQVSQHEASQGAARRRRRSRRRNIDWTSTAACHLMMFEGEDWDESSGWRAEAVANNECQVGMGCEDQFFWGSLGCRICPNQMPNGDGHVEMLQIR